AAARRKQLAGFKAQLLDKQQSLLAAYLSSRGDTRAPNLDGTEDYIDYAVNSYDREFMLSLSELERIQLVAIEEALKRVERGEYGRCLQCGQEIPAKRLEVEPWARHCVRCQELEEQGLLVQPAFDRDLLEEGGDDVVRGGAPDAESDLDDEVDYEEEAEEEGPEPPDRDDDERV
ncbi:MAG TPA: TraR/DksA family transcriptional regulator, partial [Candidatus Polarisedimenticolaceae bacterium]|nr:TraR/DksA family transcriptional regulator [Candidatus Polarisedimenticolaceae bacterium]